MLIKVLWKDNRHVYVQDVHLDNLINEGEVQKFFRPYSNEWVNIEDGSIRNISGADYTGPERRFKTVLVHANCRNY